MHELHLLQTSCLRLMVAVRRALSGAPALDIHRSTNLCTAATPSFSSDKVAASSRVSIYVQNNAESSEETGFKALPSG